MISFDSLSDFIIMLQEDVGRVSAVAACFSVVRCLLLASCCCSGPPSVAGKKWRVPSFVCGNLEWKRVGWMGILWFFKKTHFEMEVNYFLERLAAKWFENWVGKVCARFDDCLHSDSRIEEGRIGYFLFSSGWHSRAFSDCFGGNEIQFSLAPKS